MSSTSTPLPSAAVPPIPVLPFAELAPRYDVILCDVWGVLHNGANAFAAASDALTRARAAGRTVILVSNAPRPNADVGIILDRFGVPRTAYDAIVTSGDVTTGLLRQGGIGKVWHLGPERDLGIYQGAGVELVAMEACERVVCTGLFDDTTETPDTYRDTLAAMHTRGLTMICANPDIVVERGGELIWCAGALAEAYQQIGGAAIWCGKPHRPIYEAAFAKAVELRGVPAEPGRVLAIGDALRTDLAGALGVGIDCLFIAGGIHAGELGLERSGTIDPRALARLIEDGPGRPVAAAPQLVW
ncbi:TIGR01459 family HAD-type hydrolase [Ancylobacter defluvii]|uniref:Haloacid dehalogenase n=1 Tax=Ancylobacter defluvii TaxID=1282440 RepID=A0A9W6JVR4_9HYPH|nr:TIGR01459 family HAD-type hydrolase [Ancylobacter defluvii]MBS7590290.1 TIGR01459 family HAD-type hydrolase [Ancylobacter defluvii]GLK83204.1 haloacid dehalogenase [Ancylobacter defluvii]